MAKIAVEKLISDVEGLKEIYIDPDTGLEIPEEDLEYYTLLTDNEMSSQLEELGLDGSREMDVEGFDIPRSKEFLERSQRERDPRESYKGGVMNRSALNNYGFIADKPAILDYMSIMPGPPGFVAKAGNMAIGLSNRHAISKARNMLGLQDAPRGGLPGNEAGYVGDISYGGRTTPVGFEAQDHQGRTTLTPNEARMRMALSGAKPATKDEVKDARTDFKTEYGKKEPGFLSTLGKDAAKVAGNVALGAIAPAVGPAGILAGKVAATAVERGDVKKGLAALTSDRVVDTDMDGVDYSHPERGEVTRGLTERTTESMAALGTNTPGGINVTSSYRDPETNAAIGGAANSLHTHGAAYDVSTKGMDWDARRDLVERAIMSGAQEIGTYADQSIHVGTERRFDALDPETTGGVTAMYDRSRFGYENSPGWFQDGLEVSRLAATPTPRPQTMPDGVNNPAEASATVNLDRNLNQMDNTSRMAMALTLAGEIDQSKTDLSTPEGIREAEGIMSTMENRIGKYGSITKALEAPNQYSTWNTQEQAKVAIENYTKNPEVFDSIVRDYALDQTKNLGFTSYHADHVNPGWSKDMTDVETIGPHKFGTVADLQNSKQKTFGSNFGQFAMTQNALSQATKAPAAGIMAEAQANVSINPNAGYGQMDNSLTSTETASSKPTNSANDTSSDAGGSRSGGNLGGSSTGGSLSSTASSAPSGGGFASAPSSPASAPSSGMTGTDANAGKADDDSF